MERRRIRACVAARVTATAGAGDAATRAAGGADRGRRCRVGPARPVTLISGDGRQGAHSCRGESFIIVLVSSLNKKFRKLTHDAQNSIGSIIHVVQEVIQGNKIVKIFKGYDGEESRFNDTNNKNRLSHMNLALTEGINSAVIMLIVGSSLSGIILLSTFDFILESITVGSFVSFMFAMFMILGPARGLASINARLHINKQC